MPDLISELYDDVRRKRIQAPESFADQVMTRMAARQSGGFKSMPVASRVMIFAVIFLIYSSLGILLGVQSFKNLKPDEGPERKALVRLMDTHHLNTQNMDDMLFRHLNSDN